MTIAAVDSKHDPISIALTALARWDEALEALAEVRETFTGLARAQWDVGISRYLKICYDGIVADNFGGDYPAAADAMDAALVDFDVKETVHRACAVSDAPLMMEIVAYAMALGSQEAWRAFELVIGQLYREIPEPTMPVDMEPTKSPRVLVPVVKISRAE